MTTQNPNDAIAVTEELASRQILRRSLEEWWERLADRSATWDLETVKHLVVLNAAGFAGVATLLAGSKPPQPGWLGRATLLGYGFGVALAILNMYLVSVRFDKMTIEIKERIVATQDLSRPMDNVFDRLTAGRRFGLAGQICGWGAAILAVLSTLAIGFSLVK
ncbi:hypothetical protein [Burkholderia sp. BCC1993]|uniref:hypothetical protein n=1 Tax=Burkholderia sp. BCC1993 TaxID=2817444 RepID=UPI002AB12B2E|nr:hypothetical protein [Burkholderia sp. BCC1993]